MDILKALELIESICGDDFMEDLDMRAHGLRGDLKTTYEKLTAIYCIAHSHLPISCYDSHKDWREEAERKLKDLKNI